MSRLAWSTISVLIVLLVAVDRGYVLYASSHSISEITHEREKTNQDQENFPSPIRSVLSDVEGFIDAHETLFIVLFTGAIAWFTGTLWRSTSALETSAAKQSKDMQVSLRIAGESADTAKRTVETMEETAERQLRAYVAVTEAKIVNIKNPGMPDNQQINIQLKNFGQTPAYKGSFWLEPCINDNDFALVKAVEKPQSARNSNVGIIAPGGDTFTVITDFPLLSGDSQVYQGKKTFYVYGEFHYADAFAVNRVTYFRYMRKGKGWTHEGNMYVCPEGNDAT